MEMNRPPKGQGRKRILQRKTRPAGRQPRRKAPTINKFRQTMALLPRLLRRPDPSKTCNSNNNSNNNLLRLNEEGREEEEDRGSQAIQAKL